MDYNKYSLGKSSDEGPSPGYCNLPRSLRSNSGAVRYHRWQFYL